MSSKPRKPGSGPKRPRQMNPLGNQTPSVADETPPELRRPNRQVAVEKPEARQYRQPDELPRPATRDQLLVALSELDGMSQEVMIARRLAAFPVGENNVPVNIPRMVRGPWARNLRKLGLFCIPELATHEVVDPNDEGAMATPEMQSIDRSDLWEYAKQQNPKLAEEVESASTPAERRAAMRKCVKGLPTDMRIILERLISMNPSELEPE